MTFEDLIYSRLCNDAEIGGKMATFNGAPAIFFQQAAGDRDAGWENIRQYPRITFFTDMEADAERQTQGRLTLNIWCDGTGVMPEDIEPAVKKCLSGVFLTPKRGETFCFAWVRSEAFEIKESQGQQAQQTQIIGAAVTFDLFEFPRQITTNPDPVLAINEYMRTRAAPGCVIIGYDELPEEYTPTATAPAVYWRFGKFETDTVSWAVAWVKGTLTGHIFAPTAEDRLKWLKIITHQAAVDEEARMQDGSPMFFTRVTADSGADFLRRGQLGIGVRYGILRDEMRKVALNNKFVRSI